MSGQTIINGQSYAIVIGAALWLALVIAEGLYEAHKRRRSERRASRERWRP